MKFEPVLVEFKRRWDDDAEVIGDNFQASLPQKRKMDMQFTEELAEASPWPFRVIQFVWVSDLHGGTYRADVLFLCPEGHPANVDEIEHWLYDQFGMTGTFRILTPSEFEPTDVDCGNLQTARIKAVQYIRDFRPHWAWVRNWKRVGADVCEPPEETPVLAFIKSAEVDDNSSDCVYVTLDLKFALLQGDSGYGFTTGATFGIKEDAPILVPQKWTVVGVHDGEEVFAHVECLKADAWEEAVRQVWGADYPEDAVPSGYTGMCLAILEGWQEKGV